jgi:hypothetical protein
MKKIIGIVLVITLLCTVIMAVPVGAKGAAKKIAPSDEYLATEFNVNWGNGTLTITDIGREGVLVEIEGETMWAMGISDNFWDSTPQGVSPLSRIPRGSYLGTEYVWWADASGFKKYEMVFHNVGENDVLVNLYINTGYTDFPWYDAGRDTYTENEWTLVRAGKTQKVTLDLVGIPNLNEVSNVGFQVANSVYPDALGSASLIVNGPGD